MFHLVCLCLRFSLQLLVSPLLKLIYWNSVLPCWFSAYILCSFSAFCNPEKVALNLTTMILWFAGFPRHIWVFPPSKPISAIDGWKRRNRRRKTTDQAERKASNQQDPTIWSLLWKRKYVIVRNMSPSFQPNYRCTSPTCKPKAPISHLFSLN